MPSKNTLQILDDLRKAGLDVSGLERQMQVSPLVERQADNILGGGILRQSEYTRYMNDLKTKETTLQGELSKLASLHDARDSGIQMSQAQVDAIKQMEDTLIATGEFDEASIRTLSRIAQTPAVKVIQPNENNNNNLNQNNNNISNNPYQPQNQPDLSNFVDAQTFRQELGNIAYGGIATNMLINAALDEVKELGIKVDRPAIVKFQEKLKDNYERGVGLDETIEETFEVSKARQAKNDLLIENRINEEAEKRVAERLKEAGVPVTKKFNFGRRHPIFDRKREVPVNVQTSEGNNKTVEGTGNQPPVEENKLPVNKFGDVEVFRGRRSKEDRMQNASALLDKVMEHYSNDPTYVE